MTVPLISLLFSPAMSRHAAKAFFLNDAYMETALPAKRGDDNEYKKAPLGDTFNACKELYDKGASVSNIVSENFLKMEKARG